MVACDFNLNFTFISCGWEGSASDAGVLRLAISKGFQVPEGKFFLVDDGYANAPQFRLIEESDITLLSFGDAHLEEENMLITKSFSIIVMHFLETILRGLLGFLRKGFKFRKWEHIIP